MFLHENSQEAVRQSRPYSDNASVSGHGPSLEESTRETPLAVGSPQRGSERTLGFREYVGDYQRQLLLVDHAGLPLQTVLEQLDLLGEVAHVLPEEFAALEPAHVPDAPTHAARVAAARRCQGHDRVRPGRRRDRQGGVMSRHVDVVSAGLSVPSSTRLLADRLAAAVGAGLGRDRGADGRLGTHPGRHEVVQEHLPAMRVLVGATTPTDAAATDA